MSSAVGGGTRAPTAPRSAARTARPRRSASGPGARTSSRGVASSTHTNEITPRAEQADARDEQRRRAEAEPGEDQRDAEARCGQRPGHRRRAQSAGTRSSASAITAVASPCAASGASSRRCARTAGASAWTSSGRTWSRPSSAAQRLGGAKQHQHRARAGAELDPRVGAGRLAERDHVAAQRVAAVDRGDRRLGGADRSATSVTGARSWTRSCAACCSSISASSAADG